MHKSTSHNHNCTSVRCHKTAVRVVASHCFICRVLLLMLLVFLTASPTVFGQWVLDATKAKNLIIDTHSPYNITSLENPNGGTILVWQDKKDSIAQLLFQSIDATGKVRLRADGKAISTLRGNKENPFAMVSRQGYVYVLWKEIEKSGRMVVYLQKINPGGFVSYTDEGLAIVANHNVTDYSCSVSDSGAALIASIERKSTGEYQVRLQKVSAAGALEYPEGGHLVASSSTAMYSPQVVPDPKGGAFVFWLESMKKNNVLMANHIKSDGSLSNVKRPISISPNDEMVISYKTFSLRGNKLLTLWQTAGGEKNLYYQTVTLNVELRADEAKNLAPQLTGSKSSMQTILTEDSMVVAGWVNEVKGNKTLAVQKIDNSGKLVWGPKGRSVVNRVVNCQGLALTSEKSGDVFVSWIDRIEKTKKSGICAQHVRPDGSIAWDSGGAYLLQPTETSKSYLTIISDKKQGILALFKDQKSKTSGIYGQRIFAEPRGMSLLSEVLAATNDDSITVSWHASNESLVKNYRIESFLLRSAKDTTWLQAGTVAAKPVQGNNQYRFSFVPDSSGVYFIRIVQLSATGTLAVSEIQKVSFLRNFGDKIVVLQNNPNPFSDSTVINFYLPKEMPVKIEFYNSHIERIEDFAISDTKRGKNRFVFHANKLPPGIYFYRFVAGDMLEVKKFVIAR